MALTFLALKNGIRREVWPSGEARSRRPAHDRWFIDALVEIQKYVACFQQNNTDLIPHCATHYNCGLTSFTLPRGRINRLSVVNRKETTEADNPTASVIVFTAEATVPGSAWDGYPNTFNNGYNNGFSAIGTKPFVKYTFAAKTIINQYVFDVAAGSGDARPSTDIPFLFEGSQDGSVWVTIDSRDVVIAADSARQTITVPVTNTTAYLYYKLSIGGTNENFQLWGIFIYALTFSGATQATGDQDWCSEITYDQIDACHMRSYLATSVRSGCCLPQNLFFALPQACLSGKGVAPVPTDEGVPAGLPVLPLGYHYPQESTDASRRALRGYWAMERGMIFLAPWINSTETIIVRWDGIKRDYLDGDLVENDPELIRAVKLFIQKEYERDDNRDVAMSQDYERQFNLALQALWYECKRETEVKGCEPSHARQASPIVTLYYNDAKSFTAACPSGQTGSSKTVSIPAGSVSSTVSVSDANAKAYEQAQQQAEELLVCTVAAVTYYNTAQTYTATCEHDEDSPVPDGVPSTVTIQANDPRANSTVSQAAANAIALALATAEANAALVCTFWNSEQSFTAECPEGQAGSDVTKTIAAHVYSSPLSQSDADALALTEATNLAVQELVCDAVPAFFPNTPQNGLIAVRFCASIHGGSCAIQVSVTIGAARFYGVTVLQANVAARDYGLALANSTADARCAAGQCGNYGISL